MTPSHPPTSDEPSKQTKPAHDPTSTPTSTPTPTGTFVDIGANLLDPMYRGSYRDRPRHDPDLNLVLDRAWENRLDRIIITCGTIQESQDGLLMARTDPRLFATVGVHPTRCGEEFGTTEEEQEACIERMRDVLRDGREDGSVVAVGELGLDYARLKFCDVENQKRGFIAQLQLAKEMNLPLFLHNRETGTDLLDILKEHYYNDDGDDDEANTTNNGTPTTVTRAGGVVHSFDDTLELAQNFIDLGLYIGINGCSLKTAENLQVVRELPLDRLLIETDCPWCDIRASHAGSEHVGTKFPTRTEKKYEVGSCVKGRYEPCHIVQVAEVIAGVKGISVEEVAGASKNNAYALFGGLVKN